MPIDNPTRSALVLIEYQNEFLATDGKLHAPIADVVRDHDVIRRTNQLIQAAREATVPIIHVMMEFAPGHRELGSDSYGILKLVKDTGAFELGSWGAELHPDLDWRPEDIVVGGKRTISAFDSTNLASVISVVKAERIYLAGQLTNLCIESTMRSAYDRGLEVVTVTDAMSTLSTDLHATAVEHVFPFFSAPTTTEEVVASAFRASVAS